MRIEGRRAQAGLAQRQRHQRRGVELADPRDPRDERRRPSLAAHPARLLEQAVRLAGQRRYDGDDLFAVADVAVNLLDDLRVVVLVLEDRASELEDTQSFDRDLSEDLSCFFDRA